MLLIFCQSLLRLLLHLLSNLVWWHITGHVTVSLNPFSWSGVSKLFVDHRFIIWIKPKQCQENPTEKNVRSLFFSDLCYFESLYCMIISLKWAVWMWMWIHAPYCGYIANTGICAVNLKGILWYEFFSVLRNVKGNTVKNKTKKTMHDHPIDNIIKRIVVEL